MEPVRTAIIGCGPRSYGHVEAVRAAGALELVCACDILPDRAHKASSAWQVRSVLDYRAVLADPGIEAVIVATDVANHLAIARAALLSGRHIVCEKPLGDDLAAARELVALAESNDRVAYAGFQLRFMPLLAAIKAALPDLDPVQVYFSRCRGMMKPQFLNPAPFCGAMDFCAHDFDMVSWFMGRAPEAVTAVLRRNTFTRDTGAVDSISALIDFGDGRSATVVSSIGAAAVGAKYDIIGARGNLSVRGDTATGVRFCEHDSEGDRTALEFPPPGAVNPDVELQKAFAAQIRTGSRSQAATLRDGLNSLLVTLACLQSMTEKRRVALAELA